MNLGSVMIGSSEVPAMKDWYRAAFAAKENEMGAFEFGGAQLFIEEHSEVAGPTQEPARVILNLDVEDCRAVETHLRTLDVTWVREVEQMPFGLIGTVADPDGNYVQIIQWGAQPEAHKD
ncbi:VOC family protein [Streptosporangium sp. NPDC051023]|uniref:VOC family protein n=1 Tax=Streptosporangium sp. NPDC051023 TaxID=3155410 RepID=UPI00344EBE19